MRTKTGRWARAPYAASEAEVLPVEAQMSARAPWCLAQLTATVMPRSLNEPVGFSPSCLAQRADRPSGVGSSAVSYTHLRAHETRHDLVCRLLLEKKKKHRNRILIYRQSGK